MAKKEKQREYTEAEKRRLANFEKINEELHQAGYHRIDLVSTVEKANTLGLLYGFILEIPFAILFFLTGAKAGISFGDRFHFRFVGMMFFMYVLIAVHELIHGITWSRFVKGGFKSIEFGVIWKMLTPYCTCREPMKKAQYLTGTFMPCLVLGIIPSLISCFTHSFWLFLTGFIMILGAGGDLLIMKMALSAKTGPEALCLDHPAEVGLYIFDK